MALNKDKLLFKVNLYPNKFLQTLFVKLNSKLFLLVIYIYEPVKRKILYLHHCSVRLLTKQ